MADRLKVALDATPLAGEQTGVGVFCSELLAELAHQPGLEVGAFALSRKGRSLLHGRLPPGVRALGPPGPGLPARALHASWARWPFPPAELYANGADVVHGTNFVVPPAWRAATVVTVHDLSPLHNPAWAQPAARRYPELVRAAVKRGAWVHADSAFVADEVHGLLGVPAGRVRTVYPGVRARPTWGGQAKAKPGGEENTLPAWAESYVLALGTVEPRKAVPGLVRAFGRIASRHPGTALVVAGPDGSATGELAATIAASPAREAVVRLGWVCPAQRDALLAGAAVFAYPSLYEGFGLPPLEAMSVGTPVVASSAGALPEVLGDAALLVPPGDEDALAGALDHLLSDQLARERLARRGQERAKRYSWERCALEMAALYREAAL
jgi:glycosyltransferase involved in cell wall biosynthesis